MKSNNLVLTLKTSNPYQIKDVHAMSFKKCMIDNKSIVIFFATQANQGGVIGIILDAQWYEPHSNSQEDIEATERMQMFQVQWYVLMHMTNFT
jgi:beta-glucosidase/6-phospho-beta-glucosidase/beta-galactosidase